MTAAASEPGRGFLGLATDPVFGPFIVGKTLANIGIWVFNVAAIVLVYDLTRSPLLVGLVTVVQFTPQLLLASLSGSAADRGDRRRQVVLGRSLCVCGPLLVGATPWFTGSDELRVWVVMLGSLLIGLGFVVGGPALQAMVPSLVRPAELSSAVAMDNFGFAFGRAVGPAVGAGLATGLGLPSTFLACAFLHLVFVVAVARLPGDGRTVRSAASHGSGRGVRSFLGRNPAAAAVLLGVTAVGVGADPALTLAPSIAEKVGGGTELVGLFASAFGIGALVAFLPQRLLMSRLGTHRTGPGGLVVMAAGSLGLVWPLAACWAVACFTLTGLGMTLALTALSTELYVRVPDAYRGRVMALWLTGFVGSRPLAAGLNGLLADLGSVVLALVITTLLVLGAAWCCRPAVLRS